MEKNNFCKIWLLNLLLVLVLFNSVSLFASDCSDSLLNSPKIQKALVENQWNQVFDIIKNIQNCELNGCVGLLEAHAALANGKRNNEATILFSVIHDSTSLINWYNWTKEFSERHPESAVGHYLFGDAKVRLIDFKGAISEFKLALEKAESFFLARNALGVLNGIIYQVANDPENYRSFIEEAIKNFEEVRKTNPEFVDATLNMGVSFLEANLLPGAMEYFNKSIIIDNNFALAYNGRAILFIKEQNIEMAKNDIIKADSLIPRFPYIINNAKLLADASDTTSALGRLAKSEIRTIIPDTARGAFSIGTNLGDLTNALGRSVERFAIDGFRSFGESFIDMTKQLDVSLNFGGIYFDVQLNKGTQHASTNYILSYPRPKLKQIQNILKQN